MSAITVFLACPIGKPDSSTRQRSDKVVEYFIEPAVHKVLSDSAKIARADWMSEPGHITEQILHQLTEADIVIADLTDLNANVMYEVGYRQASFKPYILIAEKGTDLPFDLSTYRTVFYELDLEKPEKTSKIRQSLEQQIRASLKNNHEVLNQNLFSNTIKSDYPKFKDSYSSSQFFNQNYVFNSDQFKADFRRARELWVLGLGQNRMIRSYGHWIKDLLNNGGTARFILCDPEGSGVKMSTKRGTYEQNVKMNRAVHREAIERLASLSAGCPGILEIKTIDLFFPFTFYGFDVERSNEPTLYIWMTPLFEPSENRPGFTLSKRNDRNWFDTFTRQFKNTWTSKEASPVDLTKFRLRKY